MDNKIDDYWNVGEIKLKATTNIKDIIICGDCEKEIIGKVYSDYGYRQLCEECFEDWEDWWWD